MWQSRGKLHPAYRVRVIPNKSLRLRCAFINFKDRISAEHAAEAWANGLDMDGERLGIRWGRSKSTSAPTPAVSVDTTAG